MDVRGSSFPIMGMVYWGESRDNMAAKMAKHITLKQLSAQSSQVKPYIMDGII